MTTLLFRAVAIMLCVSVFATSASAECAWVLWYERTALLANGQEQRFWGLVGASTSENSCRTELTEKIRDYSPSDKTKEVKREVRVEGNMVFITYRGLNIESEVLRYVCLPDTVDPRGPKAK